MQLWVGNLSKKWCILGRLGEPQLAKKALKNDAKKTSKKIWKKKDASVRECTQKFALGKGGVPIRSLRAQAPGTGSYRQCSKKPDKTLWPLHFVPQGHGGGFFFIFWAPEALGPLPNCRSHVSAQTRIIESFWNLQNTSFMTKQCTKTS